VPELRRVDKLSKVLGMRPIQREADLRASTSGLARPVVGCSPTGRLIEVTIERDLTDADALSHFIEVALPDLGGPFQIERLGEGLSCLTFALRGKGWEVVLRRPPRGKLPPTAYDVTREYRVMRALSDAGADVPVPRPLALCRDPSVIGAPF
jgi:hypothetical protein